MPEKYRLWTNEESTILVELWHENDELLVMTRPDRGAIWSPPIKMNELRSTSRSSDSDA